MQPYLVPKGCPFGNPALTRQRAAPPSRATAGGQSMTNKSKGGGEKLTRPVSFRLTAADHAAYLAKVEASGLKPSEFFRECVLQNRTQVVARVPTSSDKRRLLYLFNKTGNNMNQLAHAANAAELAGTATPATYAGILASLHALEEMMQRAIDHAD